MKNKNKCIKCSVENCKHNNENYCDLDEIKVDSTCDGCDCADKCETICDSFKEKKNS